MVNLTQTVLSLVKVFKEKPATDLWAPECERTLVHELHLVSPTDYNSSLRFMLPRCFDLGGPPDLIIIPNTSK